VLFACQQGARTGGQNGAGLEACKGSSILRDLEVGRPKQGEQSPLRRTYETTQAPWSPESRHPSRGDGGTKVLVDSEVQREAPTSPRFGSRRHRVLGIFRGGEHAHRSSEHRCRTRVLRSEIAGPCCSLHRQKRTVTGSPLFPASQTIGLAPGTERYGTSPARDGAEKNGRRHGSSALRNATQVERRAEQTWTGATASHRRGSTARRRARVSESCCRYR
jgi:hypothetical protein